MSLQKVHETIQKSLQQYTGRFAYVISYEGEKIEHNSRQSFSSASTIKVPLLIEALRQCEEGRLDLNNLIPISEKDIVGGAGVIQALTLPSLPLKDLLALMIIVSDNTATNLVIDHLGFSSQAFNFHTIGLSSTQLQRKMMDFENLQNGKDNFICADDLHTCLQIINESSILSKTSRDTMKAMLEKQQLRDKLPYFIEGDLFTIANKTGELKGVDHDCGIITFGKHTIYVTVLTSHLKHQEDGQAFIRNVGKELRDFLLLKENQ